MPSDDVSQLLSRWHRNFDPDHPLDLAAEDGGELQVSSAKAAGVYQAKHDLATPGEESKNL